MRSLSLLCCALLCVGCSSTSYKVAPSTAKVATKLATARQSNHESQTRTTEVATATKTATVTATTTAGHIDAALSAILARNPDQAVQELIAAKTSNAVLLSILEATLRNVTSLQESQTKTDSELVAAETEAERVNKAIETMAVQGAKDRAIVEQGEWGFGLGYFIVGIKRILSHAFWGSLILIGVVVVICVAAFFVGGPMLAGVKWAGSALWGLLHRNKTQ